MVLPIVVTEVMMSRTGGDDQVVESVASRFCAHGVVVNRNDGVFDHSNVSLAAEDVANRRCDVGR